MTDFLSRLMERRTHQVAFTSFEAWWSATARVREQGLTTVERGIASGFVSDRVGMAFAGGYTAAVRALDRRLKDEPAAFCVTEDEGGHPRAINARLEGGRVWGTKRFVSLGPWARTLLVVASEGTHGDGRKRLKVLRVSSAEKGVHLESGPALPFIPEVPHASVVLEGAEGEVLPGDGYGDFVKPFRSLEDVHVTGAVLGYLLGEALRGGWPEAFTEELLVALCAAQALGHEDLSQEAAHLALAGFLTLAHRLTEGALRHPWSSPEARERFVRDLPLFQVARHAREARRQRAWELVSSE